MRRWNGWGEQEVYMSLSPKAKDLLVQNLGEGTPQND